MQVYRFRVQLEEQDDFLRDIDVKPGQNFRQFHECLKKTIGLEGEELASFFVCDHLWRKKQEITLIDMMEGEETSLTYEDEETKAQKQLEIKVMDDIKIKEVIEDPHQRFVYEYDFLNPKTFYIELTKIVDGDESKSYPLVAKEAGILAKTVVPKHISDEELDEDDRKAMLDEFNEMVENEEFGEEIDEHFAAEPEW